MSKRLTRLRAAVDRAIASGVYPPGTTWEQVARAMGVHHG